MNSPCQRHNRMSILFLTALISFPSLSQAYLMPSPIGLRFSPRLERRSRALVPSSVFSASQSPRQEDTPIRKRRRISDQSSARTTPIKGHSLSLPRVVTPPTERKESLNTLHGSRSIEDALSVAFEDLCVSPTELRPSSTLTTGQCFHWRALESAENSTKFSAWGSHDATKWIGVLRIPLSGESIVVVLKETPQTVLYRTLYAPSFVDVRSFLYGYFQLPDDEDSAGGERRESLGTLYAEWSTQCDRLKQIATAIPGVRIIDQDPWECLVSFLCSSNNNIPRITKILSSIRREYGDPILPLSSVGANAAELSEEEHVYSFPSFEKLKKSATDKDLRRKCGMGYRAKYLLETMTILDSLGGEKYLQYLRSIQDPQIVQAELVQFCGIGRKVADCIALFSLRQKNAIPVDVHVWNIARRDYGADSLMKTTKTLTPTLYKDIGDLFRSRFPRCSGWAHSLLFVSELPSFRDTLPSDLVVEMDRFRAQERENKKSQREAKKSNKLS